MPEGAGGEPVYFCGACANVEVEGGETAGGRSPGGRGARERGKVRGGGGGA